MAKAEQVLILEPSQELKFRGEVKIGTKIWSEILRYFGSHFRVCHCLSDENFKLGTWGNHGVVAEWGLKPLLTNGKD